VLVPRREHRDRASARTVKGAAHRLSSLDAFRGLAIAGMILVNNPGNWDAVFESLTHANWDGCTLADVVFPFFIFIVGAVLPFAFARRLDRGQDRRALYVRILRRTAVLFALGLVLNLLAAWPQVDATRVPGVLQRIAIVYLVTAIGTRHAGAGVRFVGALALFGGHWAILALTPFGGHAPIVSHDLNVAAEIDRAVFGVRHMLTPIGDPEGLLGTLPAIGTALLGTLAGEWLITVLDERRRFVGLLTGGVAAIAAGLAWSAVWPLNKPLWSGSYALFTAGLATITFGACYLVVDVERVDRWAQPFIWLGVNPLAIYFASELARNLIDREIGRGGAIKSRLFWGAIEPVFNRLGAEWASLIFALATLAVWTAVAGVLHRRGIRMQV
jgi:predicted acyltransferase